MPTTARMTTSHIAAARGERDSSRFQLQRMFELVVRGLVDVATGQGQTAWERIERECPAIRRSLLFRIHYPRFTMLWLHAMVALAAGSEKAQLRAAERDARDLAHLDTDVSRPVSEVLLGAVAARRGNQAAALRFIASATDAFDEGGMAMHAAALRRRRGELIGGDEGRELVAAADDLMRQQNVKNPERVTEIVSPRPLY